MKVGWDKTRHRSKNRRRNRIVNREALIGWLLGPPLRPYRNRKLSIVPIMASDSAHRLLWSLRLPNRKHSLPNRKHARPIMDVASMSTNGVWGGCCVRSTEFEAKCLSNLPFTPLISLHARWIQVSTPGVCPIANSVLLVELFPCGFVVELTFG